MQLKKIKEIRCSHWHSYRKEKQPSLSRPTHRIEQTSMETDTGTEIVITARLATIVIAFIMETEEITL